MHGVLPLGAGVGRGVLLVCVAALLVAQDAGMVPRSTVLLVGSASAQQEWLWVGRGAARRRWGESRELRALNSNQTTQGKEREKATEGRGLNFLPSPFPPTPPHPSLSPPGGGEIGAAEGNGHMQSIPCHCHVPPLCVLLGAAPPPLLGATLLSLLTFPADGVQVMPTWQCPPGYPVGPVPCFGDRQVLLLRSALRPPHSPALPPPHAALTYLTRTHGYYGLVSCCFYHFCSVSSSECKTLNIALVITVNFITSTLIGLVSDGEFSPERDTEIFWCNPFFQLIVEIGDVECGMGNNQCGPGGTRGVRGRGRAHAQALLGAPSSHMGTLGAAGTPPCPRAVLCHGRPTGLALGPGPELRFAPGNMELCCY